LMSRGPIDMMPAPMHERSSGSLLTRSLDRSTSTRRRVALATVASYALLFVPLDRLVGSSVPMLTVVPIAAAASLLAPLPALLLTAAMYPLNTILLELASETGWNGLFGAGRLPSELGALSLAGAVAALRLLRSREHRQTRQRELAERRLAVQYGTARALAEAETLTEA